MENKKKESGGRKDTEGIIGVFAIMEARSQGGVKGKRWGGSSVERRANEAFYWRGGKKGSA